MPTPPDTGAAMTPAAAATLAATMESLPKPEPALSARADAEAMAACETELYARGGDETSGGGERERRRRAAHVAATAASSPATHAIRQSVRALAHSEKHRHPALSKATMKREGAAASAVPFYAAVAAGGGAAMAARAKYPRTTGYEILDQRARAGVYAVANLASGCGSDAICRADAGECGDVVASAGAPDRLVSSVVTSKIERATQRGKPEGKGENGLVTLPSGTYPLFGSDASALPRCAWDEGCSVCGGDIAAGPVLLCDDCDGEYHCACLSPPLPSVPDGEWFCPGCVRAKEETVDPDANAIGSLATLLGTQLRAACDGDVAGGTSGPGGGSTRRRAADARRLRALAASLGDHRAADATTTRGGGGWATLSPSERLDVLRELTWQLLDSPLVRGVLEVGEKKSIEAREALRSHVRDWASFRKYGVPRAVSNKIAGKARAQAEDVAEAAEAEAAAIKAEADAAKAAAAAAAGEAEKTAAEGETENTEKTTEETDADGAGDEMDGAKVGGDKDGKGIGGGPGSGPAMKSYAVRMAGIAAANDANPVIPEAEGRARWQAKWHELEGNLRANDLRLDHLGVDRDDAAYWLIGNWGLVGRQPSGAGGGEGFSIGGLGGVATSSAAKKKKRKSTDGVDDSFDDGGDVDVTMEDDDDVADANADAKTPGPSSGGGGGGEYADKPPDESMWGVYGDAEKVATLAASLNEKGEREGSLWSELQRRFGAPRVEGPKPPSVESGDEDAANPGEGDATATATPPADGDLGRTADEGHPGATKKKTKPLAPPLPPIDAVVAVPPPPPDDGAWKPPRPVGAENSEPTGPGAAIAAARTELLAIDAALPDDAMCPARGSQTRRASWRRMTTSATDPATLAMSSVLLEASLAKNWLSPAWLPWSNPAPALRAASRANVSVAAAGVLMRAHALRRAVVWGGGAKVEKPPPPPPPPRETREERAARRAREAIGEWERPPEGMDADAAAALAVAAAADAEESERKRRRVE